MDLVMTPQLQMAIKMLSMSLDELLGEVDRLRKENPLISVQTRTSRPIGQHAPPASGIANHRPCGASTE